MKKNLVIGGCAMLLLTACGGTSGSGDSTANAFAFTDVDAGSAAFSDLATVATNAPISDRSDLPAGGGATYDGLMSVTLDNGTTDGVLGTVRLDVGYGDNSLSGSAGSFVNFNNEAVDGSLLITGGNITSSGVASGTAEVNGSIDFEAGTMTIEGTATHAFSGGSGEYNFGAFLDDEGTAQPAIGGPIDVDASWVAQRQ